MIDVGIDTKTIIRKRPAQMSWPLSYIWQTPKSPKGDLKM